MNNEPQPQIAEPVPITYDICLIEYVSNKLRSVGLIQQCNEAFLAHPLIAESIGKDPFTQRNNLNIYFLYQLASYGSESMEARYCLINDGKVREWARLFDTQVLPFLISKNLPKVIH